MLARLTLQVVLLSGIIRRQTLIRRVVLGRDVLLAGEATVLCASGVNFEGNAIHVRF